MIQASPSHCDTLVIGAGISGLSAAYQLHQAGKAVRVIEASPHAGGLIRSHWEAGFLTEAGPNTFPSTATEILELCEQLRLEPQATHTNAKKRYLYLNGKLTALPGHPLQAVTTPALSLFGKLRALQEPFRPRTRTNDISVAEFLENRVGKEVVERLADPFISGIYAGNVAELSLPAVFPKLWQWEQSAGSLLKGARQAKQTSRHSSNPKKPMQLLSFAGGLESFISALVNALPEGTCHFGHSVTQVEATETGYQVQLHTGELLTCHHVIIATPAYTAARLIHSLSETASNALQTIPYNGLAVVHLGFNKADIPHPLDGFGCLIPRREKLPLLGTIWASSLFPNRAPEGQVLLSNFIGGAHHPEIMGWPPAKIEQLVLQNLQTVFNTPAPIQPAYSQMLIYDKAIPQYSLGHLSRIQTIEAELQKNPHLHLCGNYLHGIALNECVKSGLAAANAIIDPLK